ncbi:hypothetical protein TRFO_22778 [Tritrichomonas foetus]|uniref:Uncharacterized protein n=1 Tax=Tritrichomonas foetus TaxID=1144522 RepID=A0A1J4KG27_9EUKA|nr:hypothetical protein TRFO_22778 [Tritrichomonas foetus]|eukprot:OHT08598.1 hypothetical protein TRFO_22778 [Tritrichomonas foetus]
MEELTKELVQYYDQINGLNFVNDQDFSFKFGELHHYCQYFITTREISFLMKTITDLTLSNLIEPLQELTIELYNNLTSHEIKREIEFKTSLLLSYYISIMISLIVFIFSLVFFVLFTKSIEKNLFYILRTVQSDVILEIQQKFNKLLAVEKSNRKSPKFYAHCNLIWSFSIMTISSIFFPFYISIMLLINDPSQFKEMPPYLNISNQDELAYYTLALTEYNISDQKSCFHNYSMIECSDCIKISKMLYLDSHIIIVNVMIVAFSISFVVFIFEYYHSIEMYDTVQILLRFIPIHASESNPILKALWYGQNLTKSDVHHLHKHLILRKIKNTGFFGVLYFNEEYETIKTIGNVVDILHYHPTSLWRLSTYIREHSSEKGELIDQFFSEKKNLKTISISLEAFHEVSFTFSNNGKI